MHLASIEDSEYKAHKFGFWKNVYGINMSCIAQTALLEPLVDSVNQEMVNSSTCKFMVCLEKAHLRRKSTYSPCKRRT